MIRPFLFLLLFTLFVACKKNEAPVSTTNTVKYECKCTPLLGAMLTGSATYSSPTSNSNSGTLVNNTWSFTQNGWNLKSGDRLSASTTVQGNSNCTLTLYVDDIMKAFQNQSVQISGQNPTNSLSVVYLVP